MTTNSYEAEMRDRLAAAKTEIERLTRERDEARTILADTSATETALPKRGDRVLLEAEVYQYYPADGVACLALPTRHGPIAVWVTTDCIRRVLAADQPTPTWSHQ